MCPWLYVFRMPLGWRGEAASREAPEATHHCLSRQLRPECSLRNLRIATGALSPEAKDMTEYWVTCGRCGLLGSHASTNGDAGAYRTARAEADQHRTANLGHYVQVLPKLGLVLRLRPYRPDVLVRVPPRLRPS